MLSLDPMTIVTVVLSTAAGLLLAYTVLNSRRRPNVHYAGSEHSEHAQGTNSAQSQRNMVEDRGEAGSHLRLDTPGVIPERVQVEERGSQRPSQEAMPSAESATEDGEHHALHDQLQRYFQEVSDQYKLPPMPTIVTTALQLVRDPDVDVRTLCRVLTNDAALAGRILSMARSPLCGLRRLPSTLQEALPVLGMQALRRILMTAGTHMLYGSHSKVSGALWNHSLATALTAQILAERTGRGGGDQAFLMGLLHDIGQMVVVHGDSLRFGQLWQRAQAARDHALGWERETYKFDHAQTGASILYRWHLETDTITAVLGHHNSPLLSGGDPSSPTSLLQMANYVADQCALGFLSEPLIPSRPVLAFFGCDDEEAFKQVKEQVSQAFLVEKKLFS